MDIKKRRLNEGVFSSSSMGITLSREIFNQFDIFPNESDLVFVNYHLVTQHSSFNCIIYSWPEVQKNQIGICLHIH